jgi:hypothetical protein
MSTNSKAVSAPQIDHRVAGNPFGEPKQLTQYSLLADLPGLVFGLLTLVYVVSALWLHG